MRFYFFVLFSRLPIWKILSKELRGIVSGWMGRIMGVLKIFLFAGISIFIFLGYIVFAVSRENKILFWETKFIVGIVLNL